MHAPPARPAGSGREKDATLDTSALVCLSSQPLIMRNSEGIVASALSLNMMFGLLDGWMDGWMVGLYYSIVQYTVGFQLMECNMHNAMMTFFVKKKNESFSPTLNFSDNENEKSARPLIDGMGVIN